MAFRKDAQKVTKGKFDKAPGGGIRVDANLTRTGVFKYYDDSGKLTRELRHPDDVFDPSSLETLPDAPLTLGHPGMVTPASWKRDAVGHVNNVRRDGKFVAAKVIVQDEGTVQKVLDKELVELSCGYSCTLVPEKGTYEGETYDARQTEIRYNHVGIGGRDWGRAGNEVRVHLDGKDGATCYIDGMTLEEALALIGAQNKTLESLKADSERIAAERDTLKVDLAKAQASADTLKADSSEDKIAARVDAKVALLKGADKVLGEHKFDSKTKDAEIVLAVLVKHDASFKADGKSAEYLKARFDLVVEGYKNAQGELEGLRTGDGSEEVARGDGLPVVDLEKEKADMAKRIADRKAGK